MPKKFLSGNSFGKLNYQIEGRAHKPLSGVGSVRKVLSPVDIQKIRGFKGKNFSFKKVGINL